MRLIGMLDSPYVRRVAISLNEMQIAYTHEPLSVFRDYDAFAAINPVVKAPTLVTDDGTVLMESTLLLDHLERLAEPARRLTPVDGDDHARALRIIGLALAACDKTVQIVYELNLRPQEKHHQPWLDRVRGQLAATYRLLEAEIGDGNRWLFGARPLQADITTAVAWHFTQEMLAGYIDPQAHPGLALFSQRAERLPAFLASPHA